MYDIWPRKMKYVYLFHRGYGHVHIMLYGYGYVGGKFTIVTSWVYKLSAGI